MARPKKQPEINVPIDEGIIEQRRKTNKPLPIEVMLEAMDEAYYGGNRLTAAAIAEKLAPYFHPRLTATKVTGDPEAPVVVQTRSAADLRKLVRGE